MNLRIASLLIIATIIAACSEKPTIPKQQNETPKALSEKEDIFEYGSKRGSYNLVESLYQDVLTKDATLKKLEGKIDALYESKDDSLKKFHNFDRKNEAYFNAAKLQVNQITDSVLKKQMDKLVAQNLADYKTVVAKHYRLLDTIKTKNLNISDLHRVLKIVKTLPLIKSYQEQHLPNYNSLEGFIKQQDQVIPLQKKLIK